VTTPRRPMRREVLNGIFLGGRDLNPSRSTEQALKK